MTDKTLNDYMEFDHVIRVLPDGSVVDAPSSVYAPELYAISDGNGSYVAETDADLMRQAARQGWTLEHGWSAQHGYRGPCMHSSELIGGGLEKYIRSTSDRYWVCVVVNIDDDSEPDSWAVAHRPVSSDES